MSNRLTNPAIALASGVLEERDPNADFNRTFEREVRRHAFVESDDVVTYVRDRMQAELDDRPRYVDDWSLLELALASLMEELRSTPMNKTDLRYRAINIRDAYAELIGTQSDNSKEVRDLVRARQRELVELLDQYLDGVGLTGPVRRRWHNPEDVRSGDTSW